MIKGDSKAFALLLAFLLIFSATVLSGCDVAASNGTSLQSLQGEKGNTGPQGTQGLQGTQGEQGTQGPQGTQGEQGPQGTQGEQGPQGIQGPQSTQSPQGAQGLQGTQGPQGSQGPQGLQGPQGAQGPQGEQGAQGIQGPAGEEGSIADTMNSFAAEQYANILSQMITAYPGVWNVYTSLSLNTFSGTPVDLYPDPAVSEPGLLRLLNGGKYTAIPLTNISAIHLNSGAAYNTSFTYLPPPSPLPEGYDADIIASLRSSLPTGTATTVTAGNNFNIQGTVVANEYGILVIADSGNVPVFIFTLNTPLTY